MFCSFSPSLLAPETRSRRRLQFAATPLQGKSFFLHVKSAVKARELEKKLKDLGGVSTGTRPYSRSEASGHQVLRSECI